MRKRYTAELFRTGWTALPDGGGHDMGFVETIADRVTVLHQGVLAEGSLREVQANEQVIEVYLGR